MVANIAGVVLVCCGDESNVTPALQLDADASVETDAEADADADAGRVKGCPGETPETYLWQGPVPKVASACSESDLSKLATAIGQKMLTAADDIAAALGPSCAACAIGNVSDATWRAVLSGHERYIGNVGGCAVHLGASGQDARVIDRARGARFTEQARARRGVPTTSAQELDGHGALRNEMSRGPDRAHAAFGELAIEPVSPPDHGASREDRHVRRVSNASA